MQVVYRISPEKATGKPRPEWFSKTRCLANHMRVFGDKALVHFVAHRFDDDNHLDDAFLRRTSPYYDHPIHHIQADNGAQAFLRALDYTLGLDVPGDEIIYLVEDDYLHRPGAPEAIFEGLVLGFDYVTLYDHPDKYFDTGGPNPCVKEGAEDTRLYLGPRCHFKLTNSTTMTFACKLGTLRKDAGAFYGINGGATMPQDFQTFCRLREEGRTIGSAVPGFATHCESKWLSPLVDWEAVARR